jgi:hypothetical protein
MIKNNVEEDDGIDVIHFREVVIRGMNESIMLVSNFECESMKYLTARALRMYAKIKTPKENNYEI